MMGQLQQTLFSDEKIVVTSISQLVNKRKIVFKPYYQDQQFLLPKNIDDFVAPGHIARLISKIIDNMDVQHVIDTYKGGGTSSYNPKMLLKSWILGFANRIYSCRLVAKALRENLPFIWISGNQTPDFRTLNNFMAMGGSSTLTPVITLMSVVLAVSVSLIVGVLSSLYPAWKAARMSPIEAVRYE